MPPNGEHPFFYLEKGHFCYHVFAIKQNVSVREIKQKVALLPTYALRHNRKGGFVVLFGGAEATGFEPTLSTPGYC